MFRKRVFIGIRIVLLISFLSPPMFVHAVSATSDSELSATGAISEENTTNNSKIDISTETNSNTTTLETTSASTTEESTYKDDCSSESFPNGNEGTSSSVMEEEAVNTRALANSAEPDTGMIYTPSENQEGDPLKGGTLAINQKFSVPGTEVAYNAFLRYHIGFRITWTVPEGMTPQQFINALDMDNTIICLGSNKLNITRDSFKINKEGNIEYQANDDSFDLFSIIKYLWSLIFGKGEADIWSYLHLDVNKISENNPNDFSKNKIVTKGKLIPNKNNKLSSTVAFYNREDKQIRTNTLIVSTWSNYISPWNASKATSEENGKEDDTQVNGSTEVQGVHCVLKGENYKSRKVGIPITEKITPSDYIRVVNLFTKQVVPNVPVTIDGPNVTDDIVRKGDTSFLNRSTTYFYRGNHLLSPVSIKFFQKSHLKLVVTGEGSYSENEEIPIKGTVETEGKSVTYFYSINHGKEILLKNKSNNPKQIDSMISDLNAGKQTITIKAVNEFGLYNTVDLQVTIYSGQLSLHSVPNRINFGETKISSQDITLVGISEGNLVVSDTRPDDKKTNWSLNLKKSGNLVGKGTTLTYINRENNQIRINDKNQLIEYNLPNRPEIDNISDTWRNKTRGLFLNIPPEDQKIGEYSGILTWTLQDTPKSN
ncbi:hypothetical protein ACFC37_03040 [Enterococcus durans]|uniref:hypothetical protein n=1 Tax=Enterococcus durans TaxID=53345 RepID=UPI0039A66479